MMNNVNEIMLQLKEEGSVFRLLDDDEINRVASYFEIYNFPGEDEKGKKELQKEIDE